MNGSDAATLLAALPGLAFGLMLVLCRVSAAVMVLPGIGESEIPMVVRAALAVGIAVLIYQGVRTLLPAPQLPVPQLVALIAAELACGLLIGWLARLLALSLPIAGQIISTMIGLSSVLQPGPRSRLADQCAQPAAGDRGTGAGAVLGPLCAAPRGAGRKLSPAAAGHAPAHR